MNINELVYSQLTENTGAALGDSGGAYGRHWERNQKKSLADFEAAPGATLEIRTWTNKEGKVNYEFDVTIDLFHKLTTNLDLDDLCDEFNALPVADWDGVHYGTSLEGCRWLADHDLTPQGDAFNSYNGDSILSQVIQGQVLYHNDSGNLYILLQIHNGCDIRGGYTDAKLYKLDDDYAFISESCGFSVGTTIIDYHGGNEFIGEEGQYLDSDELDAIAQEAGVGVYHGDIF